MDELCVSASDLRVHFKDLANTVAAGGQRVLVSRHGYPMVALVSQEDLAFLRKHRPAMKAAPRKSSGIPEVLEHPESMPLQEVERLYAITKGLREDRVVRWREKAWLLIKLRTGKFPDDSPYWFLDKPPSLPGHPIEVTPPQCR
jgi:prevent-host-death family protein